MARRGCPQRADNPPGGFTWSKDKDGRDWIVVSCEGEGAKFGGPIRIISLLKVTV